MATPATTTNKTAIYKPVRNTNNTQDHTNSSNSNDDDDEVVIFTIDENDNNKSSSTLTFCYSNNDDDDDDDDDVVIVNNESDARNNKNSTFSTISSNNNNNNRLYPMEIMSSSFDDDNNNNTGEDGEPPLIYYDLQYPWFLYVLIHIVTSIPILLMNCYVTRDILGGSSIWYGAVLPFAVHLLCILVYIYHAIYTHVTSIISSSVSKNTPTATQVGEDRASATSSSSCTPSVCLIRCLTLFSRILDVLLVGFIYPFIWDILIVYFFTDIDGTANRDWLSHRWIGITCRVLSKLSIVLRLVVVVNTIGLRTAHAALRSSLCTSPSLSDRYVRLCPTIILSVFLRLDTFWQNMLYKKSNSSINMSSNSDGITTVPQQQNHNNRRKRRIQHRFGNYCLNAGIVMCVLLLSRGAFSVIRQRHHYYPSATTTHKQQSTVREGVSSSVCDPIDESDCFYPFPSFHHLRQDDSTVTGWRVALNDGVVPHLKSSRKTDTTEWNQLDGFSTMGPILFYLDGMKEAHDAGIHQLRSPAEVNTTIVQDNNHNDIGSSSSVTFLIDVTRQELVAHSASIGYLNDTYPSAQIFPAQPLYHNRHYAVAVINAVNEHGVKINTTAGMRTILYDIDTTSESKKSSNTQTSKFDIHRKERYIDVVLPALYHAAPWIDIFHGINTTASSASKTSDTLQLLFDFHTISAESQLGQVRDVRDETIERLSSANWDWVDGEQGNSKYVRTVRIIDHDDCASPDAMLARTIHAELTVPWFLTHHGNGSRSARLDPSTYKTTRSTIEASTSINKSKPHHRYGKIKFIVHIPCSVRAAALGQTSGKPLRAVMDFGHGLFGTHAESFDDYLVQFAHEEGYVITATEWRGMSTYDLLVVAKVLVSDPSLFFALRDNMIQGYCSKLALQHFSRHALLSMDWMKFVDSNDDPGDNNNQHRYKHIPTLQSDQPPEYIFYGISQGAILGGGYVGLAGPTGLIDRAILGSAGTPFSFIMMQSLTPLKYKLSLLMTFANNRQARAILGLFQMGWDTVEVSGTQALPHIEPIPPMLIQSAIGDGIVPALSAESLARAFEAKSLVSNPRDVYGIPKVVANGTTISEPSLPMSNGTAIAVFSELVYDVEVNAMQQDNVYSDRNSSIIHVCLRRDKAMMNQIAVFINTAIVVDPCDGDGCHRSEVC